jgi:threonine dehydratase
MITEQRVINVSVMDIKQARQRIKGKVNRTPLLRFYSEDFPGEIYLKL